MLKHDKGCACGGGGEKKGGGCYAVAFFFFFRLLQALARYEAKGAPCFKWAQSIR